MAKRNKPKDIGFVIRLQSLSVEDCEYVAEQIAQLIYNEAIEGFPSPDHVPDNGGEFRNRDEILGQD